MVLNAVIVEDDPLSLNALRDLLSDIDKDIKIIGTFSTVSEAVGSIESLPIDLLFLDMELPDGKGFDVLEALNDINFEVVIITNYDSFMLEAFKHSAMDYLKKPLSREGITEAISRFHKRRERLARIHLTSRGNSRLVIPNLEGALLVEIADIIRLQSAGAYTYIYQIDGTKHLASKNIGYFENKLVNHGFIRVHHSHLVNASMVKNYSRMNGGFLTLTDNTEVAVSRRKKDEVISSLKKE